MMPDLGKYADAVLSSYVVSIALLVILVGMSLRASRKARAELQKLEDRRRG
ncbi:MAG: heme exporter protein CcmD [Rhodobacteraceae bacterium]|nr:heme exporter protein CcmD [Paracoccaceae bacterium]MCW9041934.1 heme exporter protein CcmD [Pseudopelagicola sp.]